MAKRVHQGHSVNLFLMLETDHDLNNRKTDKKNRNKVKLIINMLMKQISRDCKGWIKAPGGKGPNFWVLLDLPPGL